MAEKSVVVTSGTTRATVVSPGEVTRVVKVTVGRPVRRVVETAGPNTLGTLRDVNLTGLSNGSVLVYSSSTERWTATVDLEEQNINGGSY